MTIDLETKFQEVICHTLGATNIRSQELIQKLWSGYGRILRLQLTGSTTTSVIVKQIQTGNHQNHPRGWNSDTSHQRKLKSYEVEQAWYQNWSHLCSPECRIPKLLTSSQHHNETLLVLEDLDNVGFPKRLTSVSPHSFQACLDWLANFHATFLNTNAPDLWKTGTYWHLATRSDELAALDDLPLKKAAPIIDQTLSSAKYQTLVHGDAKLANFCFSLTENKVAAVDFQYTGHGCGMKDLAYFIGSCLSETDCKKQESAILDYYFKTFRTILALKHPSIDPKAVESEWRHLFPFAWADFHRFLKGWSPSHWKINSYSEKITHQVLNSLS